MLVFYEQNNSSFWRIERKREWVKIAIEDMDSEALLEQILAVTSNPIENAEAIPAAGKNTDEVLAALIDSDFDLNTLDEWDKIRIS